MSLGPVAQRRQLHGDDVDPEVQVLAEAPRLHLRLQVAVGGAHQPHVHPGRLGAAHRPHLAVLQGAQQLGLHLRPHVADLVEEQRALVGQLEQAALGRHRPGERPAHVAEQLGLQQRFGQRRAVDRHERLAGAGWSGSGWPGPPAPCRCRTRPPPAPWRWWAPPGPPACTPPACAGSCPRSPPAGPPRPGRRPTPRFSAASRLRSSARVTVSRSSSTLNGLLT